MKDTISHRSKGLLFDLSENLRLLGAYWTWYPLALWPISTVILAIPLNPLIGPMIDECYNAFCGITLFILIVLLPVVFFSILYKLTFLKKTKYYLERINQAASTKEGKKAFEILKQKKPMLIGIYDRASKRKFYHWLFFF